MDEFKTKTQDQAMEINTKPLNNANGESKKELYEFVSNKIEKLSTAVYMVSFYIEDSEPIKKDLRVVSLSCVASAHALTTHSSSAHVQNNLQKDIKHTLALVRLADTMTIMSHMNAEILSTEYKKIQNLLNSNQDRVETFSQIENHIKDDMDARFFENRFVALDTKVSTIFKDKDIELIESKTLDQEKEKPTLPLLQVSQVQVSKASTLKTYTPILDKTFYKKPEQVLTDRRTSIEKIDLVQKNKGQEVFKKQNTSREMKERKSGRQEAILQVLECDIELSIKDVAKKVRGCSEKTIQRELNTLVEIKKAKRIGEKRWSKYLKV